MKTGWEIWGYSAWTKEEYRSTLQQLEKDFLQVIRQEGMTFNWRRVDIPWGWRSTSGPNKLWMPHPRKCSRPGLMELGAIWWYMGVPAHGMGLELGNLVGFFQLKPFYDSMMIFFVLLWNVLKLLSWTRAVKSTQVMCQICFYLEAKKPPNILSCFFFFSWIPFLILSNISFCLFFWLLSILNKWYQQIASDNSKFSFLNCSCQLWLQS